MDVRRVRDNLGDVPLVDRETHWPRLLSAIAGGNELLVTLDLTEPLVDMRDTVTRLINDLVAEIGPSTEDWRELVDGPCVARLLWCMSPKATA